jgi:predicted nucleic acid-binding protein
VTLVLDASALVEYLLWSELGQQVGRLMAGDRDINIPHLAVVETASALRTATMTGRRDEAVAQSVLTVLPEVPAVRWPAEPFLARVWELRNNVTAYDAVYLALAEVLRGTLVTTDAKFAAAARVFSDVEVLCPDENHSSQGG